MKKTNYRGIPVKAEIKGDLVAVKFDYLDKSFGQTFKVEGKPEDVALDFGLNQAKPIIDGILSGRKNHTKHE